MFCKVPFCNEISQTQTETVCDALKRDVIFSI
ncbi:hypothetical protein predicted by Glimmer/Critica [Bdellovibrio bacteriovorus HD100]|uniref:Uncharacterized protein n=1 Tax=Bdellovibrio bacteriovorus (strain ATCC 15356 / DSM 50701 / NCIMB 9529 / HD100) TaxID=264462 RepID=Q6MJX3_BDEBA|nr:hypothetical protein predicted by Glimmer/Critica [Bdellovibrio bacteriovorus HD100]